PMSEFDCAQVGFEVMDRAILALYNALARPHSTWIPNQTHKAPASLRLPLERRGRFVLACLLDGDLGAGLFELGLGGVGLVLRDVLLHVGRRAVDDVLGLLQAQAGELADGLDDVDLVWADLLEHDGELRLLLDGRRGLGGAGSGTRAWRRGNHRRCGA